MVKQLVKLNSQDITKQVGNKVLNTLFNEAARSLPSKLHSVEFNVKLIDNLENMAKFKFKQFANGSIHLTIG